MKKDLLYKDKEYEIYKKDTDILGVFMPMACIDLIEIGTNQLKNWENGGLANWEDYQEMIDVICTNLQKTVKKYL